MLELPIQPTIPKMPPIYEDNTDIFDKIDIEIFNKLIDIDRALKVLNSIANEMTKFGYRINEIHEAIHELICQRRMLERILYLYDR